MPTRHLDILLQHDYQSLPYKVLELGNEFGLLESKTHYAMPKEEQVLIAISNLPEDVYGTFQVCFHHQVKIQYFSVFSSICDSFLSCNLHLELLFLLPQTTGEGAKTTRSLQHYQRPLPENLMFALNMPKHKEQDALAMDKFIQEHFFRRITQVRLYGALSDLVTKRRRRIGPCNETANLIFQIPTDQGNCLLLSWMSQVAGISGHYKVIYLRRRIALQAAMYPQKYWVRFSFHWNSLEQQQM